MPKIPREQVAPYGPYHIERTDPINGPDYGGGAYDQYRGPRGPPDVVPAHLTMDELAQRWRRTRKTIERHYQKWGLVPLRFGGRLLFPMLQVLEAERRAMTGALTRTREFATKQEAE